MEMTGDRQGNMGRRDFLALTGGIVGALSLGSLSAAGPGYAAPAAPPEPGRGGGDHPAKRILVAYASKHGSTGGVAEAIARELRAKGAKADVLPARNVKDLSSYQGVVVGGAIYRGKWMGEAADFVEAGAETLRRVPVAYFMVCMTMRQPSEENRQKVLAYLDPVLEKIPQVKPAAIEPFAGAMNYGNLSWLDKKIIVSKGLPEGDFRDWETIRAWAGGALSAKLGIS